MKTWLSFVAALAIAWFEIGDAKAGVTPGDTITGVFDSIVFQGCVWNGPGEKNPVCGIDNTSTAPPFACNKSGSCDDPLAPAMLNTLRWGTDPSVPSSENFSSLTFQGLQIPEMLHSDCSPTNVMNCFKVGTILFKNGSSQNNSLIFGATLNFYDNSVSLGSMEVLISSTQNNGTPAENTDYINICGNNSMICNESVPKSLNPREAVEGGMGATADIFGTIVGDPQLILADMVLTPGQSADTNGFVGDDLPVAFQAPEPPSWTVLIIGLGLIIVLHIVRWAPAAIRPRADITLLVASPERPRR
jgi:hypothetical protein